MTQNFNPIAIGENENKPYNSTNHIFCAFGAERPNR